VAGRVTVEFFGIPRQRAGRAELAVEAATVADVLAAVRQACPRLADLVGPDGRPGPHYLLSVNGRYFVADARQPVGDGDRVLVLSADAGG
jgi:molybdopterin converting factor small subunit